MQNLDEKGLHTVLCEVEVILNSRPITKASTDPNDLEALTPNHLLFLRPHYHFHQDTFREKTYMLAAGGHKFSICQICSGKDGKKNIFPNCRNDKNGLTSDATSHQETS